MMGSKDEKTYAAISASIFAISGIWIIVKYCNLGILFCQPVMWAMIYIGLGIVLQFFKKNIGLLILTGIAVLFSVFQCIQGAGVFGLVRIVVWALLFAVFFINKSSRMENKTQITKILWFLPAVFYLFACVLRWFQFRYFSVISYMILPMISDVLPAAAMFFAGFSLVASDMAVRQKQYVSFNNVIGGADQIRMYKELWDSGAITHEEFELRKRHILGLDQEDTTDSTRYSEHS